MRKKTAEILIEQDKEVRRIVKRAAEEKQADLEAWEWALRAAVLAGGATALCEIISAIGIGKRNDPLKCSCDVVMEIKGVREKTLLTIMGPVVYRRSMYECPSCSNIRYPGDEGLDVVGTTRTPGLRRMMARAGSNNTFKEASEDLNIYAGVNVSAKDIERVAEGIGDNMTAWAEKERADVIRFAVANDKESVSILYVSYDGTGVPMTKEELDGRKGKQPDGSAKTREAKLGCVFTQTTIDEKGRAVRDQDSTTFTGAIESAEDFGWRIYGAAVRTGLRSAEWIVTLGDGAEWVKNIADTHFPSAIHIIDLYHAKEHVSKLCKSLFGNDEKRNVRYRTRWWTYLECSQIEKITRQAERKLPGHSDITKEALKEIAYLKKNKERMRYKDYRAEGLFVGSGVIEAGCKSVICGRLKRSSMEWTVRGANAVISLRCMIKSDRFEDYWSERAA
jgi:hypothetical protein